MRSGWHLLVCTIVHPAHPVRIPKRRDGEHEYRPQQMEGLDESQGCYACAGALRVRMRTNGQVREKNFQRMTSRQSCAWAGCGAMATVE